jgi:hypothetical protein
MGIEIELKRFLIDLLFDNYDQFKQLNNEVDGSIILDTNIPYYIEQFFKKLPISDNIDFASFEYVTLLKYNDSINIYCNSIYDFEDLGYEYNDDPDDPDDPDDEFIFYMINIPVVFNIIFKDYKLSYIQMSVYSDKIEESWEVWPHNEVPYSFEKYAKIID